MPVDAFWSISVYNSEGYFHKNDYNAYSLNNVTAAKDTDGSVTIQFGGCDGKIPNCLPDHKGWNYTVLLYRPREEILDGTWKFPEAQSGVKRERQKRGVECIFQMINGLPKLGFGAVVLLAMMSCTQVTKGA